MPYIRWCYDCPAADLVGENPTNCSCLFTLLFKVDCAHGMCTYESSAHMVYCYIVVGAWDARIWGSTSHKIRASVVCVCCVLCVCGCCDVQALLYRERRKGRERGRNLTTFKKGMTLMPEALKSLL